MTVIVTAGRIDEVVFNRRYNHDQPNVGLDEVFTRGGASCELRLDHHLVDMSAVKRYLTNDLSLPSLDTSTLQALQAAIHSSLDIIRKNGAESLHDNTIYTGVAGELVS